MNRVGEAGRGESVWLGWLLIRTITLFAPLADKRTPEADLQETRHVTGLETHLSAQQRASAWRAHAQTVKQAIEANAWDGKWYRRASF